LAVCRMSKTILVVDDDPEFLENLLKALADAGYSTLTAKDGREAILVLDIHQSVIDAAIIDLALPEIGGFQVIGELARTQHRPIPLIAITGAYSDVYLEVAKYLGAKVSLRKPNRGQSLTPILEALSELMNDQPRKERPATG
jgi:CheY-like chemotaxis protein